MTIPGLFVPQRWQGKMVLDGGMRNNFPLNKFVAANPEVDFVAIYLLPKQGAKEPGLLGTIVQIYEGRGQEKEALEKFAEKIVRVDPNPVSFLDFGLNAEKKKLLLDAGRRGAEEFLAQKT